jgi:hypothetical protein
MKRAGIIIGIILILVAYVFGYWPEHQATLQVRQQLKAVSARLDEAQSRMYLCHLHIHLLAIIRQAEAKNYGNAANLSSSFFDEVREHVAGAKDPQLKSALQSILQQRDAVTSALAKGDPNAIALLKPLEDTMFTLVDQAYGGAHSPAQPATP